MKNVNVYGYDGDFLVNPKVQIYFNNKFIGEIEHNKKFEFQIEEDGILTFKCSIRKTSIDVYKDNVNNIKLEFNQLTGSLNALITNLDYEEKKEEQNTQKEVNVVNSTNSDEKNKYIGMVAIIIVILVIIFNVFNGGGDNTSKAKDRALQVISTENSYYLNATYLVGKILTRNATFESQKGDWYLFKCVYTYNPLSKAGNVMLDRSNKGQVYIGIKLKENDIFSYRFGTSIQDLITQLD